MGRASGQGVLAGALRLPARNKLLLATLLVQVVVLWVTAPLYRVAGISIPLDSIVAQLGFPAIFGFLAIVTARDDNGIPEALAAVFVLLTAWIIFGPTQYLAAAWNRPLTDEYWLAADVAMGIRHGALVAWVNAHPLVREALRLAYFSLMPQFVLPIAVLGFVDRREMWRYVWCFQCIALITVIAFGIWPSSVPSRHGIPEFISQDKAMAQFFAARAGTLSTIRLEDGTGIITFPSFHAAGALLVTWALRRTWFVWPLVPVNAALCAATFLLGMHYAIDTVAAVGICAVSIAIEYALRPWLQSADATPLPRH